MLATALTIAEIVYIVGFGSWIALQKRSPIATLAWILLVVGLPVVGLFAYYLLGHRRVQKSRLKRLRARLGLRAAKERLHASGDPRSLREPPAALFAANADAPLVPAPAVPPPPPSRHASLDTRTRQLMTLATEVSDSPPSTAASVQLLRDGDETFAAIEAAIRAASHHVHLEYYIYEPDRTGTRLRDLLIERARAGIEVRLLVDGVGGHHLGRRFLAPLREAGVRFAWFSPVTLARLRPRLVNFRTHRKIVVVDGAVGFTGGINVTDEECPSAFGPRAYRDMHVRLEGAAVRWLDLVFLEDWHHATGHAPTAPEYFPPAPEGAPHAVQILASGPDQPVAGIQKLYFSAITAAVERVWLATPYFVPDESMLTALTTAALRGVDVRVLVPRRSDSLVVTAAARSYFAELLAAGVRVFEYTQRMLHSKTLVVDGDFAAIGSANMDGRSFRLNYEVVAVAYDRSVAEALAAVYTDDLGHAHELDRGALANTPLASRLFEAAARLLSPLL